MKFFTLLFVCMFFLFGCEKLSSKVNDNQLHVVEKNGVQGYIDKKGKIIIEPKFYRAFDFIDGLARVQVSKKGSYRYIDMTGKFVDSSKYDFARDFSDGFAFVNIEGSDCFIDKNMKIVLNLGKNSTDIGDFKNNISVCHTEKAYGAIDKKGEIAIPFKYKWLTNFKKGRAFYAKHDETSGIIDNKGNVIIDFGNKCYWAYAGFENDKFNGDLMVCTDKYMGNNYVVDLHGKKFEYNENNNCDFKLTDDGVNSFNCSNGGSGLFDNSFKILFKTDKSLHRPENGYVLHGNKGYFDYSGKEYALDEIRTNTRYTTSYEHITSDGLVSVTLHGDSRVSDKFGYVDLKGNIIWPPSN